MIRQTNQFMKKVIELIERHIDDPKFSVEKFSQEVGMSRRHLNRKLQALTSQSSLDFVRTMRLKRAARLLQGKSDIVTQIAYKVGFNNPAYFWTGASGGGICQEIVPTRH